MTVLVLIQAEYQSTQSIDAATSDVSNLLIRSPAAPDGLGCRCLLALYSLLAHAIPVLSRPVPRTFNSVSRRTPSISTDVPKWLHSRVLLDKLVPDYLSVFSPVHPTATPRMECPDTQTIGLRHDHLRPCIYSLLVGTYTLMRL